MGQGCCGSKSWIYLISASCRINSGNASRGLLALRFTMNKYASPRRAAHHRSGHFCSLKARTYTKVAPGNCTGSKHSMLIDNTRGLPWRLRAARQREWRKHWNKRQISLERDNVAANDSTREPQRTEKMRSSDRSRKQAHAPCDSGECRGFVKQRFWPQRLKDPSF